MYTHNDYSFSVFTTAPKTQKPYTLTGFEPGIFCYGVGRDAREEFFERIFAPMEKLAPRHKSWRPANVGVGCDRADVKICA
jgi:hypothetical protein